MGKVDLLRIILWITLVTAVSSSMAKEYHKKQTEAYSMEGCGPSRYALFCREAGYKMTVANPNTEYVSSLKMKRLYDYMSHSECFSHIKSFLCGALFPKCIESPFQLIFPCRDVCEEAYDRCSDLLKPYEEPWPLELNCSRFYDTDCIPANYTDMDEVEMTPMPPPKGTVHKGHKPKGTATGRKGTMKKVKGNRKHHGRNMENAKHGNKMATGKRSQGNAKNVQPEANMKPFWKLFKNTLSEMSARLQELSGAL